MMVCWSITECIRVCVCVCVNHQFPDLGFKLEMEEARQKRRDAEK